MSSPERGLGEVGWGDRVSSPERMVRLVEEGVVLELCAGGGVHGGGQGVEGQESRNRRRGLLGIANLRDSETRASAGHTFQGTCGP